MPLDYKDHPSWAMEFVEDMPGISDSDKSSTTSEPLYFFSGDSIAEEMARTQMIYGGKYNHVQGIFPFEEVATGPDMPTSEFMYEHPPIPHGPRRNKRNIQRCLNTSPATVKFVTHHTTANERGSLDTIGEFSFKVPLDYIEAEYGRDAHEKLTVLGRMFFGQVAPDTDLSGVEPLTAKPTIVFVGDGLGSRNIPTDCDALVRVLLNKGYQVFVPEYRGTAISADFILRRMMKKNCETGTRYSKADMASYIQLFTPDNIARDLEAMRLALLGDRAGWSLLAHGFGGWVATSYLSMFNHAIADTFIAAGMPPFHQSRTAIFQKLHSRMMHLNEAYFDQYPADQDVLKRVLRVLRTARDGTPRLPSVREFLCLGRVLGEPDGFDTVHRILHDVDRELGQQTTRQPASLAVDTWTSFDKVMHNTFPVRPLFGLLYEKLYQKDDLTSSAWAAWRSALVYPQYSWMWDNPDWAEILEPSEDTADDIFFAGEMAFPFLYDRDGLTDLKPLAHQIAMSASASHFWDMDALAVNTNPVVCIVYDKDHRASTKFSVRAAKLIGACHVLVDADGERDALLRRPEETMKTFWAAHVRTFSGRKMARKTSAEDRRPAVPVPVPVPAKHAVSVSEHTAGVAADAVAEDLARLSMANTMELDRSLAGPAMMHFPGEEHGPECDSLRRMALPGMVREELDSVVSRDNMLLFWDGESASVSDNWVFDHGKKLWVRCGPVDVGEVGPVGEGKNECGGLGRHLHEALDMERL